MICYWDKFDSPLGTIYLGAADEGLVYCSTPKESDERIQSWFAKHLPDCDLQKGENEIIRMAKEQLSRYFAGEAVELNVPLKLIGTAFQTKVWQALTSIPYGETWTYGEIAARIGCPKGPRAVGQANHNNPVALFVP